MNNFKEELLAYLKGLEVGPGEPMPLIAQEYLRWFFVWSIVKVVFGLLTVVIATIVYSRVLKKSREEILQDPVSLELRMLQISDEYDRGFSVFVPITLILLPFYLLVLTGVSDLMKVIYSPHEVLLEKLTSLTYNGF